MKISDLILFLKSRTGRDSKKAFFARLLRLAVLSCYVPSWKIKLWNLKRQYPTGQLPRQVGRNMMLLDLADKGIHSHLAVNGIREPYITQALRSRLQKGEVVVECGANIGYYALQEARLVGEAGYVYAVEPVLASLNRLKENILANGLTNIKTYSCALGNRNGRGVIKFGTESNLATMADATPFRKFRDGYEVGMLTLDTFLEDKRQPTYLRMDVEGYEYEILKGARQLLASNIPLRMFIEMHFNILGQEKVKALGELLKTAGFEVEVASLEPHPMVYGAWLGGKVIKQLDKAIGFPTGYVPLTIDDLCNDKRIISGQIEWLEVLFKRG